MKRPILFAASAAILIVGVASAKAPQFDTPARSAFLIDLSSGAVLLDKNADQRFPPASMNGPSN